MQDAKSLIQSLPEDPGVYRMINAADSVLYVGKAKNIRKRVASYFQRTNLSPRIQLMVQQVERVEVTATRSEAEALLLESNLIKSLAPKFNILFRDDKTYPYIEVSADGYPRIAFHRGNFEKGARYFGPFPNAQAVREAIQLMQKVFLVRTCENTVFQNRSRPCLLHQIHRCTAPCVGLVSPEEYAVNVQLTELFLSGRQGEVVDRLTEEMHQAAAALRFERAAALRDQVRSLQKVLHRQYMNSTREEDVDILAAVQEAGILCVNHAMVRSGRHLGDKTHFPQNARDYGLAEAMQAFLEQHYTQHPAPLRILINQPVDEDFRIQLGTAAGRRLAITAPRNEGERAWMALAEKNARHAIAAELKAKSTVDKKLAALSAALGLGETLKRIECFDISHTQGEAPVASCVVFVDGRAKKPEYRRYNITGVTPGDDYAAMRQVLLRRYEKVAMGEGIRPDLILIDGGRGQVDVARQVLAELALEDVPHVGVAKGEERKVGMESLILPQTGEPLHLRPDDPALHLIQEIRDEAHRFALAGHQARRAKARGRSRLEDIGGIGPTRRKRLLAQFGGLQGVMAATVEDLCRVDGISRKLAEDIYNRLHAR